LEKLIWQGFYLFSFAILYLSTEKRVVLYFLLQWGGYFDENHGRETGKLESLNYGKTSESG